MSTPASFRRPGTGPGPTADEGELSRFRAWLVARGYAAGTARQWTSHVRCALACGVDGPEGVAEAFPTYRRTTRCSYRAALAAFAEFRGAGG